MPQENIFEELGSEYNLGKKEVLILKTLANKQLSAKGLCEKTGVPKGRIYSFLNTLINLKLISTNNEHPAEYTLNNSKENIAEFLKLKFQEFTEKQTKILEMINYDERDKVEIIKTKEEYAYHLMHEAETNEKFKYALNYNTIPYFFYSFDDETFYKIRKVISKKRSSFTGERLTPILKKVLLDSFKSKKIYDFIICKSAFDLFFDTIEKELGAEEALKRIEEIEKNLREFHITINVVNEANPLQVLINERNIIIAIAQHDFLTGIKMGKTDTLKLYDLYFEQLLERSKPIDGFLKDKKAKLKHLCEIKAR